MSGHPAHRQRTSNMLFDTIKNGPSWAGRIIQWGLCAVWAAVLGGDGLSTRPVREGAIPTRHSRPAALADAVGRVQTSPARSD